MLAENSNIHYKFYKTARGGLDWEGINPRDPVTGIYTVPIGGGTIPAASSMTTAVANTPISANITGAST